MEEQVERLIDYLIEKVGIDNKTIKDLYRTNTKNCKKYIKRHSAEFDFLSNEERIQLYQPKRLLGLMTERIYTKEQLDSAIENNLKRIPGNLADESRREGLYSVLANLNFKCIYSDTLLVGGGQKIHLDHIIPVNLGGPTDDWNILPICGSCNSSKSDSHLLDWWEKEHTPQDESKLVYIFEYMANRLLKSLNTKGVKVVTTLTDEEIRKAIELENKEKQQEESKQQTIDLEEDDIDDYEDIEEVEEVKDQKIKRLDAITFLYQMLNHIKLNKQYIISPDNLNQGILDTPSEKDKQRLIDKKFKKLEKLFNSIYKQNKRLTGAKTDIQLLDEQRKMVEYIKSLDIVSYYHISYTYFDELQQMLDQGKTDEEIQEFCNSVDRSFNVDLFIQELQDFMATHDGRYPTTSAKDDNERKLGRQVSNIRTAKKGRGSLRLTAEMIVKLEEVNFAWTGKDVPKVNPKWFKQFYEDLKNFIEINRRYPAGSSKDETEKKLAARVQGIRQAKKGNINRTLTKEMIEKLDEINFIWEEDWFQQFYEDLKSFIKINGRYPLCHSKDKNENLLAHKIQGIRQAYKGNGGTKLTFEMIEMLNEMDFVWDAQIKTDIDKFIKELQIFIERNQKYPSKHSFNEEEKKLAYKVSDIRKARKAKGRTKLTDDIINKLDKINFIWEVKYKDRQRDWFTPFYEDLKRFIEESGRYPSNHTNDQKELKLARQVQGIRQSKKGGGNIKLTEEMIFRLDEMNFVWEVLKEDRYEDWFTPFCQELQEFIKVKGRYPTTTAEDEKERKLARQVQGIRQSKKSKGGTRLTEEMIVRLDEMGFVWTSKNKDWFTQFYEDLQEFTDYNGRYPSVTSKDEKERKLAKQIDGIRQSKKNHGKTRLTQEMIEKLDEINFIWEMKYEDMHEDWFNPFVHDLQDFILRYGKYPKNTAKEEYEKKLASTVSVVRKTYKKIKNNEKTDRRLTGEMINKLNEINFAWSAEEEPYVEPEWFELFCEDLKNFIKSHNCRYPSMSAQNETEKRLAIQVRNVRQAKKGNGSTKLTEEMETKLDAIHFAWTGKEQKEKIALFLAEQGIEQGLSA